MSIQFHFISGLPRAGSTLLSAILKQNPRFSAAMTSPVAALVSAIQPKMTGGEFGVFFDDEKRASVLKAVFEAYHADRVATLASSPVIFDTNRSWTGRMALLADLYPQAKVIGCEQRETEAIDTEHEILTEVVKAYSDARSALDSLDASSLLLTTAQEALASSQRKYDKGAADIVEMLNSQKELADAKQERVRSVSDWRSARLRLMAASGQLGHAQLEVSTLSLDNSNFFPQILK